MTIGECIKLRRKENGLSQKDLAAKIGIAANSLSRYEIGERNISWDMLAKIAECLGTTAIELTKDADIWGEPTLIYFNDRIDENAPSPTGKQISEGLEQLKQSFSELSDTSLELRAQNEENILTCYRSLNVSGKKEALKRVEELTEIQRYTAPDEE